MPRVYPREIVRWPGWHTVIEESDEKTWIRPDSEGIVELQPGRGDLVFEGDTIRRFTNPFKANADVVTTPFTGLLVGILENPVVYPGNPLCRLVQLDDTVQQLIERRRVVSS